MVLLPYFRDPPPSLCLHACSPLSFPCHIPHLVLWALIFVLGQSSSPTCRHCPPSPELFLCKAGEGGEREVLFHPILYQVTLPWVSFCVSPHLEIFPLLPAVISAFPSCLFCWVLVDSGNEVCGHKKCHIPPSVCVDRLKKYLRLSDI